MFFIEIFGYPPTNKLKHTEFNEYFVFLVAGMEKHTRNICVLCFCAFLEFLTGVSQKLRKTIKQENHCFLCVFRFQRPEKLEKPLNSVCVHLFFGGFIGISKVLICFSLKYIVFLRC